MLLFHWCRDDILQGSEVQVLVLFTQFISGLHNNKIFSRCISNLIVVSNEEQAQKLNLDESMSQIIPVYGNFKVLLFLTAEWYSRKDFYNPTFKQQT